MLLTCQNVSQCCPQLCPVFCCKVQYHTLSLGDNFLIQHTGPFCPQQTGPPGIARMPVWSVHHWTAVRSQLIALPLRVSEMEASGMTWSLLCPLIAVRVRRPLQWSNDYVTAFLLTTSVDSWTMVLVIYMPLTANQVNLLNCFLFQQLQLPWSPIRCTAVSYTHLTLPTKRIV